MGLPSLGACALVSCPLGLSWCPFPPCLGPRSRSFLVLGWCPDPLWCRFRRPVPACACPHLGPFRALLPVWSLVSLALPLPLSCPFLVWWWWEGRGGEGAPVAQAWGWVAWSHRRRALGGVGGAEALAASRRRASHAACGMMVSGAASLGFAGVRVRTSSKVCTVCTPLCLPAPPAHFTQRRSSCRAEGDHQARWAGARGGEGSVPGVLERRGEDVDLRWWRGWRWLGERERRRRGLGVEDGYGRRGEREGEVDMGRRWRARWRPGEREWWWRGLGVVDGYGWRGERGARRGVWGEGEVDVGRRRGEREWWWRGLGGRWGEGEGDMGRRWRSWWCPGERERRERGPWGSWW